MKRRTFLRVLSGAAAAAFAPWPTLRALAAPRSEEFFILIHAAGGWDVTLGLDPRNERKGLIEPSSTLNSGFSYVKRYKPAPLDGGAKTFEIIQPPGSHLRLGPCVGDLIDFHDRLCIVNGLAMNTVSHPDGINYSATGRHLSGGRSPGSSIDALLTHELGTDQLLPCVSVRFPTQFIDPRLDRRAIPLRVGDIGSFSRVLHRAEHYDTAAERDQVTAVLAEEAGDLAAHAVYADTWEGLAAQYKALPKMLGGELQTIFSAEALTKAHPELDYKAEFQGAGALTAAFTIEAMRRNLVRCIGFSLGGLDTHNANFRNHAQIQQELFNLIAALLGALDKTPHPTRDGHKLSEHAHILVFSDFCRTPQITLTNGRDHYPNNSALVISPRFKGGFVFGKTDAEQLLPEPVGTFIGGARPVAPPDLLATFLHAFGVDHKMWMRDGEVITEVLRA
jgi:hypothetical protein